MAGKSSAERAAIAVLTARILPGFLAAGCDHIEPDILQPADIFLDRSGEDIRSRTFVFTDPAGRELCLRPDLTVPACRYHLSHAADPSAETRYCYAGKAFRFQPGGGDHLHPPEFDQVGIELIGAADAEAADAEVLRLTLAAVAAAALATLANRVGGSFADAVERFARRHRLLAAAGVDTAALEFSSVFGRSLEYYTGFVFQIEVEAGDGSDVAVAGGGRYDGMLSDIGAAAPIPAVGCAIHTARLLAAVAGAAA